MQNKVTRWIFFGLAMLLVLTAFFASVGVSIVPSKKVEVMNYEAWSPELVKEFGALPVQDGGRIKPFSTWAGFELLTLNGKRNVRFESGGDAYKLTPTEWAMDCLFRPEKTEAMDFFQVENSSVIDMMEIEHSDKKARDRYSFSDFEDHLAKMDSLRREIQDKSKAGKKLDPVEDQFLALSKNLLGYISLRSHFAPVRDRLSEKDDNVVTEGKDYSLMTTWVKQWAALRQALANQLKDDQGAAANLREILGTIEVRMERSVYSNLAIMPPTDAEQSAWPVRNDWLKKYLSGETAYDADQILYLERMENMAVAYKEGGQEALLKAVKTYKAEIAGDLEARGEGKSIGSEVTYYKADYFYRALIVSMIGFLCVALGWTGPGTKFGKVCNLLGWVMLVTALLITAAGITHRSILMGRPPVGNLYDTIPFIVAASMVVLGIIELLTRKSVGLGLALFFGIIGLALAMMYEAGEGRDHMDPLIAVLRSNYWLTIHVLTITIGYAGGLLTAGLAHIYLFARWFGIDEGDKKFRRMMTRIVYGGVCFTLFFSLVGTVLGGVWANDSWGRFWGWDPKENGALIIVIWNLMILHARLGGYLREWGLHITAVLGAAWVAFSWWHVNFLGTGLHSYGFTGDKGLMAVWTFYGIEILVAVVATGFAWNELEAKRSKKARAKLEAKLTEGK